MTLFAAGVALLVLLILSYSGRRTWIAFGSTALSVAALVGGIFLSTVDDPSQARRSLVWLASKLPLVLDRQTLDELTTAMGQVSTSSSCGEKDRKGCPPAASRLSQSADVRQSAAPPAAIGRDMQAASATSWLGTKKDSKSNSRSPVVWLEEPNALGSSRVADGVSINGVNVSDQRLEEVQGTLKPDGSGREFRLVLEVEGAKAKEASVIPAGARFGMRAEIPKAARSSGGAILTFRYMYAGQRKATIVYLSPSMVARLANRGSSTP